MLSELQHAAHRCEVYAREVLAPAVWGTTQPLQAEVFQCAEPIDLDSAVDATYTTVVPGWRWGPAWSTAWFRLTGTVPPTMAGRVVALRFSSGTEAMLWQQGTPRRGFDRNRDAVVLFEPAEGNEPVRLHVEAACNHPFGINVFDWDTPDTRERWRGPTPGVLERCELAVYDDDAWRLWQTLDFARQLLLELPEDGMRARELANALAETIRAIDDRDVTGSAHAALAILDGALRRGGEAAAGRCFAVGHAHIDTAWLWPIRETRRKCLRTFANVLELMDTEPGFRFLCSQAQQYAWVERDAPALFERITERVRDGRWEAAGGMWIEPDCNVPSGESLIRQIIHGTRYWTGRFGADARQRFLYLPDTFGFSAALPQIMAQAGLDTFITNKLSWNQVNEFPHVTFRWRGLDGTEVLGHCTPGHDYNATNTPLELRRGEANSARMDKGRTGVWLQPFGFGDGGGGPTRDMILRATLSESCEGLPRVTMSRADAFCDELHRRRDELRRGGDDLPAWDGELYLELHRGTYTTQSWLKVANRRAEAGLRCAEWLAFAGPADAAKDAEAVASRLDKAWKLTLLNQFHDILPGSSITTVYDDARRDHEQVRQAYEQIIETASASWSAHADTGGLERPMLVLNPCSTARSGVVECEGRSHYVTGVPAVGAAVVDRAATTDVEPVRIDGDTLGNGLIEASIDRTGCVTALRLAGDGRNACREPMNRLVLYEDRPRSWEAWDIDAEYVEKADCIDDPAESWQVVEDGPLRGVIEVSRPLGAKSGITQRFVLEAGSPRLDIRTQVSWHEDHRLLRALFPVDVRTRRATYEIQFGHIERASHRNTSWEQAMFEVCAHSWMDLSEPGFGVALLNDGRYGHSCDGHVMGLSLLRGTKNPDPEADMGEHEVTYSLMVHGGDWRRAGVDREAHALNSPLVARPLASGQTGTIRDAWAPLAITVDGAAGVVIAAIKRAEDDDRLIVRLVETHGGRGCATVSWNLPVAEVTPVDVLERPIEPAGFSHDAAGRKTTVTMRPFQIVSLAARRA